MRRYISILTLLFISVFSGCDKDENERIGLFGKWQAAQFMSIESMYYAKNNNYSPVIDFKTDGTYSIKLDLNYCLGTFSGADKNEITISAPGCTKICCDSPFSQRFSQILGSVKSYELTDGKLKLNVPEWGWIELLPVD